jgi:hypothetical protein
MRDTCKNKWEYKQKQLLLACQETKVKKKAWCARLLESYACVDGQLKKSFDLNVPRKRASVSRNAYHFIHGWTLEKHFQKTGNSFFICICQDQIKVLTFTDSQTSPSLLSSISPCIKPLCSDEA